ncbi:serine hydrolase domain-containing protein [Thiovibrio sp. JS02]
MKKNTIISLKSNIYTIFHQAMEKKVFPGAAMGIGFGASRNRKTVIETYGFLNYEREKEVDEHTFYDLASLSKPLATVLSLLCLIKEDAIKLSDRLEIFFPGLGDREKKEVTIRNLLSHSSGFPAHREFFRQLIPLAQEERREKILALILAEPLLHAPGEKSLYSDLGFILLGLIIEKVSGQRLDMFYRQMVLAPLGLNEQILFLPTGAQGRKDMTLAPTEYCRVRKRILSGEVSDENAFAMGGVAGHAGLFGTINGVFQLLVHLLDQWQGREEHPNYRSRDLAGFLQRQDIPGSTWALGFDTPSAAGSSGGDHLSPASVGHLGFTGTSFWIDPARELVMVLLSNRVHTSRGNEQIKLFRPLFHNMVMESLGLR